MSQSHTDAKKTQAGEEKKTNGIQGNASEVVLDSQTEQELPEPALSNDEKMSAAQEEKAKLESEVAEWKSRAAYLAAEIENMNKRFLREKADLIRYGGEGVLQKVLPVVDHLCMALKAGKTTGASSEVLLPKLVEGVEMTLKYFEDTLKGLGVEIIDSVQKEFDPTIHEAVGQSANQEFKDNIITEEFQRGFKLHGKVVRAAKVIVNKV